MRNLYLKIFLISSVFGSVFMGALFQDQLVFAANPSSIFEINYPSIPGAETPQQIQGHLEKERLPLYINYFLRLFFIIAIGIAAAVLFFGGILYLVSRGADKPALMTLATNRIQQGLLGLAIIVSAYLILAIINPQLLVFETKMPPALGKDITLSASFEKKVTFERVPIGCFVDKFLKFVNTTTTYNCPLSSQTNCEDVAISGVGSIKHGDKSVYKIELPMVEALALLDRAIVLIDGKGTEEGILDLLRKCKCGTSYSHIDKKSGAGKVVCLGGKEGPGSLTWTLCEMNCKNCGKGEEVLGRTIDICPTQKLVEKRDELGEIMGKLKGEDFKKNFDLIKMINDTLSGNSADFLARELEAYSFQEDFNGLSKKIKEEWGYEVELETPKQFDPKCKDNDPFTLYAPVENRK